MFPHLRLYSIVSILLSVLVQSEFGQSQSPSTCRLRPLGPGLDDTTQATAIARCGHFGTTTFEAGSYNITRKMTWDLVSSKVDLHGLLDFQPNIQFWLQANNTYRVVFIQSQASWFVVTGRDFEIDAHNTGGIQGNGQPWWSFFATHTRADGDGRPIALTVWNATAGIIRNFRIESPPFWANAVAQSTDMVYDGMLVNATNTDPLYIGKNVVPNTDGIDTYRSDKVSLLNWDVTCGDDCLAIKGNSSNLVARNITCRGGNGIAFGSLGQYANMSDNVVNVEMENLRMIRLDPNVQPNMGSGVYFKSWDGSVNGAPPTGGGAGGGMVKNISVKNVQVDRVNAPLHVYQTNNAHTGDAPSQLRFSDLHFADWTGTAITNKIIDIECSPAVGCSDISFGSFKVTPPAGQASRFICQNTAAVTGLSGM
ncbi:pectin lyase fold/virulence factor [Crassisporium funariophilum]|nr:pectin lyase fold/virulence factor [Crassisporium funariophilum]